RVECYGLLISFIGTLTCIHPKGHVCNCGKRGCLEAYTSGTALAKIAQERVSRLSAAQKKKNCMLKMTHGIRSNIDASVIEKAARAGDTMAIRIFNEMGYNLGIGLSSIIHTLNPQRVILGGSVAKAYNLFIASMRKTLKENVWKVPFSKCKIVRSS
ncbi:ROK family protein, partial [Candidatus Omnitrophota bacterium]